MRFVLFTVLLAVIQAASFAVAADKDAPTRVKEVIEAAGGEDKLLKLFRIKERLNVTSDETKPGNIRTSVLEPPEHWWVGTKDRVVAEKEPATFLVWGWTLRGLIDPKAKVEKIADVMEADKPAFGLRISDTITPPMDLYFDPAENRLVRIDWRNDTHRFSDWMDEGGVKYPAKCIGYKKATGKPWYFSRIEELERLQELPAGLKREAK